MDTTTSSITNYDAQRKDKPEPKIYNNKHSFYFITTTATHGSNADLLLFPELNGRLLKSSKTD